MLGLGQGLNYIAARVTLALDSSVGDAYCF